MRIPVLAMVAAFCVAMPIFAGDWPQWGGPERNFKVKAPALADGWGESGPNIMWKRDLGGGHAALVARDGVLYVPHNNGTDNAVTAIDAKTGKDIWSYTWPVVKPEGVNLDFGTGPNTTPLLLKDRMVLIDFAGKLICLDLKGKLLWSHDMMAEYKTKIPYFGYSASPILYKGNVIVQVGGESIGIAAFNPKNGEMVAKGGPYGVSHGSPRIMTVGGLDQIVFYGPDQIYGADANTLEPFWEVEVTNQYHNNSTDPIPCPGDILLAPSQLDSATRALKMTRDGDKIKAEQVWHNANIKNHYWNGILLGDFVYMSLGSGSSSSLACFDYKTGEIKWRERGFNHINSVYADGKVIFIDHDGKLGMGKISPEKWTVLAQHELLSKPARTAPVLLGDKLYARDHKILVAIDLAK